MLKKGSLAVSLGGMLYAASEAGLTLNEESMLDGGLVLKVDGETAPEAMYGCAPTLCEDDTASDDLGLTLST